MLRRSFQLKLFFAGVLAAALALLAAVVLATAVGEVDVQAVLLAALWAFGIALICGAAAAYFMARPVVRRARAITNLARRYRGGDLTRARLDYGDDELGMVAR